MGSIVVAPRFGASRILAHERALAALGAALLTAESGRVRGAPFAGIAALGAAEFDAALVDLNYARDTTSGEEGLDLLSRLRACDAALPVIDSMQRKGHIHKNKAARHKSRLNKALKALAAKS